MRYSVDFFYESPLAVRIVETSRQNGLPAVAARISSH